MSGRFALAAVVVLSVAAEAAPRDGVDRERLKSATSFPASVRSGGWYYGMRYDGRAYEGGQEPGRLDVAEVRSLIQGNDSDLDTWQDLATAYGISGDGVREAECRKSALAILRRRAEERTEDGEVLAALGLALFASGEEAGADEAVRNAERAPKCAWAGVAASADVLLLRAIGRAAGTRVATVDDAVRWFAVDPEVRSRPLDRPLLEAAAKRSDDAVAGVEKSGATGPAAASVFMRRRFLRQLLLKAGGGAGPPPKEEDGDLRRAKELLPSDPYAVTLLALDAALSEPKGPEGVRSVQSWGVLSKEAQAEVVALLARLEALSGSSDAATAARAFQGIACVRWFVVRDSAATEKSLRQSIAKDPRIEQSWIALAQVLANGRRIADVEKLFRERAQAVGTAKARIHLAGILAGLERWAEAETEWRHALALDPAGYESNLGLAVLVLRQSKDGADLSEVRKLLEAAGKVLQTEPHRFPRGRFELLAAKAVWQGLSGDLDSAEASARQMLEAEPRSRVATEILLAIGR